MSPRRYSFGLGSARRRQIPRWVSQNDRTGVPLSVPTDLRPVDSRCRMRPSRRSGFRYGWRAHRISCLPWWFHCFSGQACRRSLPKAPDVFAGHRVWSSTGEPRMNLAKYSVGPCRYSRWTPDAGGGRAGSSGLEGIHPSQGMVRGGPLGWEKCPVFSLSVVTCRLVETVSVRHRWRRHTQTANPCDGVRHIITPCGTGSQ